MRLSDDELALLDEIVPPGAFGGARYPEANLETVGVEAPAQHA